MANDLNQCQFIGRLGKDVDSRFMPDGKAVVNFSLAVGSSWKSKTGEKQESTEWVNCVAYDKLADICTQYLRKGSQVFVSGKMKTRSYEDKQGVKKYATEIIVNEMQMLGGKQSDSSNAQDAPIAERSDSSKQAPAAKGGFDNFDDDSIPF